jgi:tetratricopeptide (TPR) repeat protein
MISADGYCAMAEPPRFQYRAFLSYTHANTDWANWLHRKLEGFTIADDLVGRPTVMGPIPRNLQPIFRDREEFTGGETLKAATLAAIDASSAMIVVCSAEAANRPAVNEEVRLFKSRHPDRPVIPVVVNGNYPDNFPAALRYELNADGTISDRPLTLLAPDVREGGDGRDLAVYKIVAGLTGVRTDEIARRAARDQRRRLRNWVAGLSMVALIMAGLAVYADVERRNAVKQKLQTERSLDYLRNVKDTYTELAGFVPEETELLMQQSAEAFLAGALDATDSDKFEQVAALAEMARYFGDSWDYVRATHFLDAARQRLGLISLAGVKARRFTSLSAELAEIAADLRANNKGEYEAAAQDYAQTLTGLVTDHDSLLDRARLHRKIAEALIAVRRYDNARSHLDEADASLGAFGGAPSERANLDDVMGEELERNGKSGQGLDLLRQAVDIDRRALQSARAAGQPIRRLSVTLAKHLQHLGDGLRRTGNVSAAEVYGEAEELATEVLKTYPNQLSTRFMVDIIRHDESLLASLGVSQSVRAAQLAQKNAALYTAFGKGFAQFKFGMPVRDVNRLSGSPLPDVDHPELGRAYEYVTDEVTYFWVPIRDLPEFQVFYNNPTCLVNNITSRTDLPDYVVFMFHENALVRISVRLYGNPRENCPSRNLLFPVLAKQYGMPLSGTPKQWRIEWETPGSLIVGTSNAEGPMLDLVAR